MDVRCARCGTDYDFDDALISERGTTVKCTNCGYQFRVFADTRSAPPDDWRVRTTLGSERAFLTLSELQQAISEGKVGPSDLLSRGEGTPRPLSSIAELQPFFKSQVGAPERKVRTLHGVAPPANSPPGAWPQAAPSTEVAPGPEASSVVHASDSLTPRGPTEARQSRVPQLAATLKAEQGPFAGSESESGSGREADVTVVPNPVRVLGRWSPGQPEEETLSQTMPEAGLSPEASGPPGENSRGADGSSAPLEEAPTTVPLAAYRAQRAQQAPTPSYLSEVRYEDQTDPSYIPGEAPRGGRFRWMMALVLLGIGGVAAATAGRKYIAQYIRPGSSPAPLQSNDRVTKMLEEGQRLVARGDFEGAKAEFDKASVLAENDPAVLAALASLDVLRADFLWLRLRLLDPADKEYISSTHRALGMRVGRAEASVEAALRVAPDTTRVRRARVDVRRLAGKLNEARGAVGSLGQDAGDPENAYVLAALDLAEQKPVWPSVIARLRTAAASDGPGRAAAALIYALARSGELAAAQAEFSKLKTRRPDHPLLGDLAAFVQRHASMDGGTDAAASAVVVDPASLPALDTSNPGARESNQNFRSQLKQAAEALDRGDIARADQLYRNVLVAQPNNTEALGGLAEIARRRNDSKTASEMYQKVLEQNPNYLPALIGSADQKWAHGDRAGAVKLYRRVLAQAAPGSAYAKRAAERISSYEKSNQPKPPAGSESKTQTPPQSETPLDSSGRSAPEPTQAPPANGSEEQPSIDTTDLPEFHE